MIGGTFAFELSGVAKTYGTPGGATPPFDALKEVELSIPHGSLTTIVGPSGSGKSTLLGLLGLLDRPSSGELIIAGESTADLSERRRCLLRARHLGFVFQAFHLMPERTVVDNVMLGGIYRGLNRRERRDEAERLLVDVGLAGKARQRAATLSGGERQRVAIARALVGRPGILLCDEPTGNLDSRNGERVVNELQRLATTGITVVLVTHDQAVAGLGNHRIRVKDGLVSSDGAHVAA